MLKGTTTFELQNVKTGEVERYIDHNMFTNALNELFNKAPFDFYNNNFGAVGVSGSFQRMAPVFQNALGGILLFPQTITENANTLFAPASNVPVGIASTLDNPNTDIRRGSFNAIESGEVTNGYKYVYDFSTSQANGMISCVCLTSKWSGATYLDDMNNLICGATRGHDTAHYGIGKNHSNTDVYAERLLGANNKGLFFISSDAKTISALKVNPYSLNLMNEYVSAEQLGVLDDAGYIFITSEYIGVMRTGGNASGNASITIDKYSLDDFEKTTVAYTIPAPLQDTQNGFNIAYDEENDYLYCISNDGASYYKTKLSNTADTTKIDITSNNSQLFNVRPYFVGYNFIIEENNNVVESVVAPYAITQRIGLYAFGYPESWTTNFSAFQTWKKFTSCNPMSTYLATINNLDRAVNKTSDKTMKVTYTVTYT